jgi:hypothetical protein
MMRKPVFPAALLGLLLLSFEGLHANAAPVSKEDNGTLVIVFKDGHQQNIPVAAIATMEVKSASGTTTPVVIPGTTPSTLSPSRRHFVGKWQVGQGNGSSFYITLEENGEAAKSMGERHGTWAYVDGEARVSWDDGWHDAIRKAGSKYEKFAYSPGASFSDKPANVTEAIEISAPPI